jgi:hypothetical protein
VAHLLFISPPSCSMETPETGCQLCLVGVPDADQPRLTGIPVAFCGTSFSHQVVVCAAPLKIALTKTMIPLVNLEACVTV